MSDNVLEVLRKLGIKLVQISRNNALCLCPLHNDHNPSFAVNINNGLWCCYSGCGKGNLQGLVKRMKRGDVKIDKIFNLFDRASDVDKLVIPEDVNLLRSGSFKRYPEIKIPGYLLKRLKKETIYHFGLGEIVDGERYAGRIIIPIYMNDEVVGFQGRSYLNHVKRYLNPDDLRVKFLLFGHDDIDSKTVILVEGVFDAMRNWERRKKIGFPTVSILGSSLHESQVDLLISKKVDTLILSLDNDSKSRTGQKKSIEILSKYSNLFKLEVMMLSEDVDPDEMSDEEYLKRLGKRKSFNAWKSVERKKNSILFQHFNNT